MIESYITYAKNKILNSFDFLQQFGYVIEKIGFSNKDEFEINFENSAKKNKFISPLLIVRMLNVFI